MKPIPLSRPASFLAAPECVAGRDGAAGQAGDPWHVPVTVSDSRTDTVTALYREHALGLIRLAHVMLGDKATAEDVVQEAFCGLYGRWQHLSGAEKALCPGGSHRSRRPRRSLP